MISKFPGKRGFTLGALILCAVFFLTFKSGLISKAEQKPAMRLAPAITATNNDALVTDADGDGIADPGDTIEYTVTINNGAAAGAGNDALGMIFTDTLDPNMTLVPGSLSASPIAGSDTFSVTGNVRIQVPDGAADLLANDINPITGSSAGLTATAATVSSASCAGCNNVVINADGSFSYNPPPGFEGADTFTYTVADGSGATGSGTVTLNVAGMIWFVNNTAAACTTLAAGCGRLTNPFSTLAALQALNNGTGNNPAANDNIFIYSSGTSYAGGIALLSGQKLIGQGVTATLASATGITLAPNSDALPATGTARPSVVNAAGNAVTLNANNTLRGLNAGGSAFAIDDAGSVGTLNISEVAISSAGGGFRADNGGTPNVTLSGLTSGGGAHGINLAGTSGGSFSVTGAVTISNTTGDSISLNNTASTFSVGGLTQINTTADNFIGIHLSGGTGAITFAGVEINGRRDKAIRIAGGSRNITTGAVDIDNTNIDVAIGLEILSPTGGTIQFGDTDINNGAANGSAVEVQSSAAAVLFGAGSTITNSNGHAFFVNGGAGNITFNGSITNTSGPMIAVNARTGGTVDFQGDLTHTGSGVPISANNNTGGTIQFTGATKSLNSGATTAVNLTTNTNATISFTGGGLDIDTTAAIGFNATGGGTINVSGASNSITTVSNTALNVANTMIGTGNLTFQSISAGNNTADADPAKGIILNTTGASGGLIVTGTGTTDGSGGTIQNITQRGVEALTTANLSLKNMTFTNANTTDADPCTASDNSLCNAAIHLNAVTGATLDNVDISGTAQNGINVREVSNLQILNSTVSNTGAGGDSEEGGLYALNLFGTSSISNSTFSFPAVRGAVIYNTNKTLNLTVNNSQFNDTQTSALGADGFELSSFGSSVTTVNISNCAFLRDKTNGVQIIGENTSTTNVNITGSSVDPQAGVGAGFEVVGNGTASMNFNVNNNPNVKGRGTSIINIFAQGNSSLQGRVNNNAVASLGGSGSGIRAVASADGDVKIEIDGNIVSNIALDNGITATATGGTGRMDATITDNNVTVLNTASYNIQVAAGGSGSTFSNVACANVANNTVSPSPITGVMIGNFQGRSATVSHTLFVQGTGPNMQANWNARGNLPGSPPSSVLQSGTGTFAFNQTCQQPTNPSALADLPLAAQAGQIIPESNNFPDLLSLAKQPTGQTDARHELFVEPSAEPAGISAEAFAAVSAEEFAAIANDDAEPAGASYLKTAKAFFAEVSEKLGAALSPTVAAQKAEKEAPVNLAGETVTVGAPAGFTLPATKSVVIKFRATINSVPNLAQVANQGTISGSNFASVVTNDPATGTANDPTVTLVDRTLVSVAASQNPSIVGQGVTLTATLTGSPAHASGNPTGTVQFFRDGNPLGAPVNVVAGAVNTGTAQITVSDFTAGSFAITATYSGGGQFNASSASNTVNQSVSNTAVWDGSASSDWNNAANWATNFAPLSGNAVSIPASGVVNNPTIAASNVTIDSLTQQSGRTLTINAGRTLTVTGDCTNNGTFAVAGSFSCGIYNGSGTVSFTGAAAQNIPPFAYQNLTVSNASGVALAGDVTVNGVLTLTNGNVSTGANTLVFAAGASVSRSAGHVVGNTRRIYNAPGSFTFPVGTGNGFSPATVNVTAGTFPLGFNVRAVQGAQPVLSAANSLQRFWQIAPTGGNPTANLTFNYLETDVAGTESAYRVVRVNGAQVVSFASNPPNVVIDTANNTATINGVTAFSDWTLGALAPTAAHVGVSGRIVTTSGRGIFNAEVVLLGADGEPRTTRTNSSGFYRFTNVPAGAIYTVSVRHKIFEFAPQVLTVTDEASEVIIIARE